MDFLCDSVKLAAFDVGIILMRLFLDVMTTKYQCLTQVRALTLRVARTARMASVNVAKPLMVTGLLVMSMLSLSAYAERSVALYSYKELVVDQSASLRQRVVSEGLASTLIKVTGKEETLDHPLIKEALTQPSRYLTQYGYESTNETLTILGSNRQASRLSLEFSESAVQALLTNAQLAVWPSLRPEVLVWVVNDERGKQLLGSEAAQVIALKASAETRALPVSMPLLDLTDRKALSAARIWVMDEDAIKAASARYDVDGILAGRFTTSSAGVWQGQFIFIHNSDRFYFNGQGSSSQEVANQVIDQVTDYLAGIEGVIIKGEADAPTMQIVVNNITGFAQYADLLQYLDSVSTIVSTVVTDVDGERLTLQLSYNGQQSRILSTLQTSGVLGVTDSVEGNTINRPSVGIISDSDNDIVDQRFIETDANDSSLPVTNDALNGTTIEDVELVNSEVSTVGLNASETESNASTSDVLAVPAAHVFDWLDPLDRS